MKEAAVSIHETEEPRLRGIVRAFLRVAAVILVASGLWRAAMLIGAGPDAAAFESLTMTARTYAASLVFLGLLAGVGLWIGAVWGPVMWLIAAAVEIAAVAATGGSWTGPDAFPAASQAFGLLVLAGLSAYGGWLGRRGEVAPAPGARARSLS